MAMPSWRANENGFSLRTESPKWPVEEETRLDIPAEPTDGEQTALRMDRCCDHICRGGRDRRRNLHAQRSDRAIGGEVSLVAGNDLVRARHKSSSLWGDRALRCGGYGPLWCSPHDDSRAGHDHCRCGADSANRSEEH